MSAAGVDAESQCRNAQRPRVLEEKRTRLRRLVTDLTKDSARGKVSRESVTKPLYLRASHTEDAPHGCGVSKLCSNISTERTIIKALQFAGVILLTVFATTSAAQSVPLDGALGANFNGEYEDVNFRDLTNARTHWLRGFITMTEVNPQDPGAQRAISTSLAAETRGIYTIFTLKWPFQHSGIPDPKSERYAESIRQLDSVLSLVMGRVDIIEIGNEPYNETPVDERDYRLNDFYEAMASRIITFRKMHCPAPCSTHLFMGALNRLEILGVRQADWVDRWLAFARETPQIDGVDIHPHVDSLDASRPYVDYVLRRLRPNQKFLATEFSLVWWWKAHLHDRVPVLFARRYGVSSKLMVWQEIAAAIENPFTQQEWNDLLTQSPWFAKHRLYIDKQVALFRSTNRLAVACYGFKQGASMTREFVGPDSMPWLLNSVYAGRTVQRMTDGSTPTNPYWLAAFRRLNKPRAPRQYDSGKGGRHE